jgi:hypothetical protein
MLPPALPSQAARRRQAQTAFPFAPHRSGNGLGNLPQHFLRIRHEPTIGFDSVSYGLAALATPPASNPGKPMKNLGFFANETHSQIDIIGLTGARSAVR